MANKYSKFTLKNNIFSLCCEQYGTGPKKYYLRYRYYR